MGHGSRIPGKLVVPLLFPQAGEGWMRPELCGDSKDRESTGLVEQLCEGSILLLAAPHEPRARDHCPAPLAPSMWLHPGAGQSPEGDNDALWDPTTHLILEAILIGCPCGSDSSLSHSLTPPAPKTVFRGD